MIEIPIPKWLVKGTRRELPDGSIITFSGKNIEDYCIIVKDKNEKIHANFTLKPDEYQLHLTNEKSRSRQYLFDAYASVIEDLTKHWLKERPDLIKIFPSKLWNNHDEDVVDINSYKIPLYRWKDGIFNVEPEELKDHIIPKLKIIRLKFSMGILFDKE